VKTERIRIWGIVQGVGMRPFVARLAKSRMPVAMSILWSAALRLSWTVLPAG